jgi:hypothetical protein
LGHTASGASLVPCFSSGIGLHVDGVGTGRKKAVKASVWLQRVRRTKLRGGSGPQFQLRARNNIRDGGRHLGRGGWIRPSGSRVAIRQHGCEGEPRHALLPKHCPWASESAAGAEGGAGLTVGQAVLVIYVPPQHLARSVDGEERVVVVVSDASQALAIGGGGGCRGGRWRRGRSSGSSRGISP